MKMTFRWYGPDADTIPLAYIRQIPGATGVVGCLMDKQPGEVWERSEVDALVDQVHEAGLELEVIESVNVHDDIKAGVPGRDAYIDAYCKTIQNLGAAGVKVVCYNFMPVFDWVKTDLAYTLPDGSTTLCFKGSELPSTPQELLKVYADERAEVVLPGWEPERLAQLSSLLERYQGIDEKSLRENLRYFLERVVPVAEAAGVKLAIHPDDPPYSLFGLPRIAKNRDDLDWIVNCVDSPSNGLALCCGSIAEDPANDVYSILDEFSRRGKIHFVHMRNIRYLNPGENRDFYEAPHLSVCGSLDLWRMCKILHDNGFDGYMRPDHGRMIWGEQGRPGYGLYDRALGIAYILGLWEAAEKSVSL